MEDIWAAYLTAVALGATHALEVDHMVAVNAFLGNRPRVAVAIGFGLRWGAGHAAAVIVAGLILVAAGFAVPATLERWLEAGVGVVLVGLGIWAGRNATRLHVHTPSDHGGHAHLHAHDPQRHPHGHRRGAPGRRHRHLSTVVGVVHGFAGTASVVALVPITRMAGVVSALWYLVAFGLGTVLTMATYAGMAAAAVAKVQTVVLAKAVAWGTALASVGLGLWWIQRALGSGAA